MSRCVVCGDDSPTNFTITSADGHTATFDSFECAIDRMAPRCTYCGVRIIGHATVVDGSFYCGVHCSQFLGINSFV